MLACLETWLHAVSDDQLLFERSLGLHVHCFAALGNRGRLKNSICSAPVGSRMLKPSSPPLEFLLTCLSSFTFTVLDQPHSNLQLLKIISIPAPGHVKSKDDPMGRAQLFAQLGTAAVELPFSAEDVFDCNVGFDLYVERDAGQELLLGLAIIIPLSMGLIFDTMNYFALISWGGRRIFSQR